MAMLRNLDTNETRLVEPEHTFGRAPTSTECIREQYISAQHATLRWTGGRWVLRDLGSRNGTYLDGKRIVVGQDEPVGKGTELALGKPGKHKWEIIDDSPPPVMVVPVDGGEPVVLSGDLLALPSDVDPQVTIYRGLEHPWMVERADAATTQITNLQTFHAAGRTWRFCCPESTYQTALATGSQELQVRHLRLGFSVSRDEEHVSLRMTCGGRTVDMGARNHNYLLLTLARRRIDDTVEGLPETSCGWMYHEDLATGMDLDDSSINLNVYRIRQQFGVAGVVDAANIVERRPRTRQLRIGTAHLSVVRL